MYITAAYVISLKTSSHTNESQMNRTAKAADFGVYSFAYKNIFLAKCCCCKAVRETEMSITVGNCVPYSKLLLVELYKS